MASVGGGGGAQPVSRMRVGLASAVVVGGGGGAVVMPELASAGGAAAAQYRPVAAPSLREGAAAAPSLRLPFPNRTCY